MAMVSMRTFRDIQFEQNNYHECRQYLVMPGEEFTSNCVARCVCVEPPPWQRAYQRQHESELPHESELSCRLSLS